MKNCQSMKSGEVIEKLKYEIIQLNWQSNVISLTQLREGKVKQAIVVIAQDRIWMQEIGKTFFFNDVPAKVVSIVERSENYYNVTIEKVEN